MAHVGDDVVRLVEHIERFCAAPMRNGGPTVAADMVELRRGVDLIELKFSEMAAAFAATTEYEEQGSVSPIQWIRLNCHMGGGAAADRVAVGQQLASLPEATEAMAEGAIGFPHLALMARTATALAESGGAKPFDESHLLDKARDFSVGRFRNFCHHMRHAADPDAYAAEQAQGVEARSLTLSPGEGGMLWLRGVLDPEGGAVLHTALEPLARRTGQGDYRKRDRRLADALVELAHHSLDSGRVPLRGSQRPHLQVTTSLETLVQRAGSPAADLEFSLPISAKAVERLACDCNVTRILLSSDSTVIDVGRSKRVISPAQKRALNVRDKGCRFPGCDRPATWTSGHHLVHWIRGGGTDLPNLVLLCYRHHWMVHEGKWQLVKTDDGQMLAVPPTWDQLATARSPGTRVA
jgi:Domain of unknown function (DUF222)